MHCSQIGASKQNRALAAKVSHVALSHYDDLKFKNPLISMVHTFQRCKGYVFVLSRVLLQHPLQSDDHHK